ncbi:hypothetical protein CCACVL1_12460 [Corchorus capsularis]|uniref:Uncharacterized protein n=1 Tax=Corchorus capsularis TaxID=210143 RepID=A0A1R3IFK1_COCAP|nr:hypothetical protein CCACVL1_12460 [Corchorus capsularis]
MSAPLAKADNGNGVQNHSKAKLTCSSLDKN